MVEELHGGPLCRGSIDFTFDGVRHRLSAEGASHPVWMGLRRHFEHLTGLAWETYLPGAPTNVTFTLPAAR
jgi:hypothetical protein